MLLTVVILLLDGESAAPNRLFLILFLQVFFVFSNSVLCLLSLILNLGRTFFLFLFLLFCHLLLENFAGHWVLLAEIVLDLVNDLVGRVALAL